MRVPEYSLNTGLLRQRIPNISEAARSVGMRPATLSDLCNGKTPLEHMEVGTLLKVARVSGCTLNDLVVRRLPREESFAETVARWSDVATGSSLDLGEPDVAEPLPEAQRLEMFRSLPAVEDGEAENLTPRGGAFAV